MKNSPFPRASRRDFLWQSAALALFSAVGMRKGAAQTPAPGNLHRDIIHLESERQVIENFGASDAWSFQMLGDWPLDKREHLADLLFSRDKGIGLSCWRFNIGGGIDPQIGNRARTAQTFEVSEGVYDWDRQKTEQWFLGAAKARGVEQFLSFVNSPPARMTRNGHTFCSNDSSDTTNLKPGFESQFARYLADILAHFRDLPAAERIDFTYLSPINEPQWDWSGHGQEGCRYSNADIERVTLALAAELKRRHIPTQLITAESGSIPDMTSPSGGATKKYGAPYGDYIGTLIENPATAPLLDKRVCYHAYFSDKLSGEIVDDRRKLAARLRKHPDWKIWQSEYCCLEGPNGENGNGRDLTMKTALNVARVIHLDLTVVGVSAWQWWTALSLVDYKDGLVFTDWRKPSDAPSIIPSKLLWALGNFSRFVRPGMKRLEMTTDNHDIRGLMGSAYKNEKSREIVLVYINTGSEMQNVAPKFALDKSGWKLRQITSYITSDAPGDDLRAALIAPETKQWEIPARAVVTFVARFGV